MPSVPPPPDGETEDLPEIRLAVACMTKRPASFITWLRYHREVLGVAHFFSRLEDSEALARYLERTAPWNSVCTLTQAQQTVREWKAQSVRQVEHVRQSITRARALEMTHLLHIDDDELLYLPSGMGALRAAIKKAPNADQLVEIHCLALEAMAPSCERLARVPTSASGHHPISPALAHLARTTSCALSFFSSRSDPCTCACL